MARFKAKRSKLRDYLIRLGRRLRRRILAELRIIVWEFRFSFVFVLAALIATTCLLKYYYLRPENPLAWGEAFFHTILLISTSPALAYPADSKLSYLFILLPIIGVLVFADAVARLGALLFQKRSHNKEWQILLASTYKNHIIVCGLGHVGYRIVHHLMRNQLDCVAIEINEGGFVDEIRNLGVPVIIADARREEVLAQANLAQARAIIIATNDDLANLEIALDARNLQPDIRVVLRLFDENLARKIQKGFNIQCAFSASAIAAPVFAAAVTERNVINSFIFNDVQLNTVEIAISERSNLIGWTLDKLRSELEITVALYRDENIMDWNPNPNFTLRPGVKLLVITTSESLQELARLNKSAEKVKIPS